MVDMHDKMASKGLVVLSVNLDSATHEEKVLESLKAQKAPFTNLLLDEKKKTWQEKLGFKDPPSCQVFGRDGKLVKHFQGEFERQEVEDLVVKALKAKE